MIDADTWFAIKNGAAIHEIDPLLVAAFCSVESNFNPLALRYEPTWSFYVDVKKWAKRVGSSVHTEEICQASSWGMMQVMGSNLRVMGLENFLTQAVNIDVGLFFGCKFLKQKINKYPSLEDYVSAYNQGSPWKTKGGDYGNRPYVDMILKVFNELKDKNINPMA